MSKIKKEELTTKDEPIVQQLMDDRGNPVYVRESTETRTYQVLVAKGMGLKVRYTEKARETAEDRRRSIATEKGPTQAVNYEYEWLLNRMRAKSFKYDPDVLTKAINAFHAVFWNGDDQDMIDEGEETVELRTVKTFKFFVRVKTDLWTKKLEKWSKALYPTKPKNAQKRADKAMAARGKIEAWIQEHIKIFKNEVATPKEQEAYYKLLHDHIFELLDKRHFAPKEPAQTKLNLEERDKKDLEELNKKLKEKAP